MYVYNGTRLSHPLAVKETETYADMFGESCWDRFFELVSDSLYAWREIFWIVATILAFVGLIWTFMR